MQVHFYIRLVVGAGVGYVLNNVVIKYFFSLKIPAHAFDNRTITIGLMRSKCC